MLRRTSWMYVMQSVSQVAISVSSGFTPAPPSRVKNFIRTRYFAEPDAESLPLLDTLETTGHLELPSDFRQVSRTAHSDEWSAALYALSNSSPPLSPSSLNRFKECRQFAFFYRGEESGHVTLRANACHNRWCPVCAAAKEVQVLQTVKSWAEKQPNLKFITFTLKSCCDPLHVQMTTLYHAFHELRRSKAWKSRKPKGCWFFQTTYNSHSGLWHPHLHVLAEMPYIPQELLSEIWFNVTGTSYIVDIKKVHNPEQTSEYVARYVSRPGRLAHLNPDVAADIVGACRGRRLCGVFGKPTGLRLSAPHVENTEPSLCIGSWSTVSESCNWFGASALILHAYVTGLPLPADVTCFREILDQARPVPLYMAGDD